MSEKPKDKAVSKPGLPSMFWPAALASALPVALGVIGLLYNLAPAVPQDEGVLFYLFGRPIWICFAFGSPLVAWLSCRALARQAHRNEPNVFTFFGVSTEAAKYSFYVHALGFLATLIVFTALVGVDYLNVFLLFLFAGIILNVLLFFVITAPLSMFCAAIFTLLYSAPASADMPAPERSS